MKILIADDSKTGLAILTDALTKLGHEVLAAPSGEQAIQLYTQNRPDLIILDVVMQQMSGFDCAKKLREMNRYDWIPLIFLSSTVDDLSIKQGIDAGGDDYLAKPFSDVTLAAKIKAMQRITDMQKKLYETTEKLRLISSTDALTGIYNRFQFEKAIAEHTAHTNRYNDKLALFFLDLDHFKEINDHLGHNTGDLLLKEVANRIKGYMRKNDFFARLGGDEFAIITTKLKQELDASIVAQKILDILRQEFIINEYKIHISCSIGIAFFPTPGTDAENIVQHADIAMYYAKEVGRNNFQYYSTKNQPKHNQQFLLAHALRFALENNELYMCYQPIYELETKKLVAMEALMRWENPKIGIITPDIFIPLAEEIGVITHIGKWALINVCEQAAKWYKEGYKNFKLSVNISSRQLLHPNLLKLIKHVLKQTKFPPELLVFELTESTVMSASNIIEQTIKDIIALKIGVSLDDFGTGYSSLSHLKRLTITTLKIDKSFVQDITNASNDALVVKSIIALGKILKL